jgi:hypothetical protein
VGSRREQQQQLDEAEPLAGHRRGEHSGCTEELLSSWQRCESILLSSD